MKVFKSSNELVSIEAALNVRTDIKAGIVINRRYIIIYIGSIKEQKDWPLVEFWRPIERNVDIFCYFRNFWGPSIYKRRLWQALKENKEEEENEGV